MKISRFSLATNQANGWANFCANHRVNTRANTKSKRTNKLALCFSAWLCWLSLWIFPAAGQPVDFSGKQITLIVPFKTDGGSYTWATFTAPYLSKHLPGNPEVVVKSQPGGGSTRAANKYALTAKPDGLSLLLTSRSTQLPYVLNDARVKYDYKNWQVLMSYPNGGVVYAQRELKGDTPFDLSKLHASKLLYGSIGVTSFDAIILKAFDLLKLDVTPIFGMRGRAATRLAFERQDSHLDFQTSSAYMKHVQPLVEKGVAFPLFTLGVLNESGNLVRDPQFPNIPTFEELYWHQQAQTESTPATRAKNVKTPIKTNSRDQTSKRDPQRLATFKYVGFIAQKLLVLPKETPQPIIDTYHHAIEAMLADPEYIKAKPAALGSYQQLTGDTATKMYQRATAFPPEHKRELREWLMDKYRVNL